MTTTHILFPLDIRLTTWAAMTTYALLGYRDRRALYACTAWLLGYEALYVASQTMYGRDHRPVQLLYIILAIIVQPWLTRRGVHPNHALLAAALTVWAIWIFTGFHVNGHTTTTGFSPGAEVLNETSKMLWALAYLIPLCHQDTLHRLHRWIAPNASLGTTRK